MKRMSGLALVWWRGLGHGPGVASAAVRKLRTSQADYNCSRFRVSVGIRGGCQYETRQIDG